ncbi:MAG: MFS transporter [Candidatus Methanomethylicaceae archaeon]
MRSTKSQERLLFGITANVLFLGIVSFFTDISTEIVVAILPTFLVIQLGSTPEIVGTIEGIAESITSFLKIASGSLCDRMGRRKGLVILGYGISNAVKPFMGFATSWTHILGLRSADRVGKGLRTPPRDAIISDSASGEKMGRAFGIHRTLDQLGAIAGPVIAFLLLAPLGYQGLFLITVIPGSLAILILIIFVKEPPRKACPTKYTLGGAKSILNRSFYMYLISAALYSLGAISYAFILLRALELGLPQEYAPLVYACIQVFHVLSGLPAGEFSDRIGRVKAIQLGYFILLGSFLVIALAPNPLILIIGAALFGAHQGVVETSQRAIIPSIVPEIYRGTAYGLYNMIIGIVTFPTNLVAGLLFSINSQFAFYYGAAFGVLASIAISLMERSMRMRQFKT